MADHGAIGTVLDLFPFRGTRLTDFPVRIVRLASVGDGNYILLKARVAGNSSDPFEAVGIRQPRTIGRDENFGNPAPPSFTLRRQVRLGPLLFLLAAGSRTISVDCLYGPNENERPAMIVRGDDALGINQDVEVVAPVGGVTAWVTLETSLTLRVTGIVEIYLEHRHRHMDEGVSHWDNFRIAS